MGGWLLVLWTALLIGAAGLVTLLLHGVDADGLGHLLRLTARTSLILFSLAFAARPASQLFGLKWLLRNRRYLGVSFAVSHGYHLVGIVLLGGRPSDSTLLFGGLGYLAIAAMVATSFDRTTAWLGRKRWKILHTSGMYGLGGFFALTYVTAAWLTHRPLMIALALVSLTAPALRLVSFLRR